MSNVAAWLGAWSKRVPVGSVFVPAPTRSTASPAPDPTGPIGVMVELNLGVFGWVDITQWVYYRDGSTKINISRGRPNEASRIQPQTAGLQLDNRDGRFSSRNPVGAWFGSIGRNTQIRVSRLQNGIRRYRYFGEVPSWPVTWDQSGRDVYVPIQAAGQLRRLQQGTQTLGSAMYRAYALRESATLNPVAYWPCEDGSTSTSIASGLGGSPMTFTGSPQLASSSSFLCSRPLPVLNGGVLTGPVPTGGTWTDIVLRLLLAIPASGDTDGSIIARVFTTGTIKRLDMVYNSTGNGTVTVFGYDLNGTQLFGTTPINGTNGQPMRVSMALRSSGPDVEYEYQRLTVPGALLTAFGTQSTATLGVATQVLINPTGTLTGTTVGHISVQPVWDSLFDLTSQLNAWNGEFAGNRYARLVQEQGINVGNFFPNSSLIGSDAVTMGYQLDDTLMNLVQQIADADGCLIYEARDQAALVRRSRISLYNQGTSFQPSLTSLTLDYAQHQLSGPLNPQDDDYYTRNDITVQRIDGSFAQTVDTSPLDALSTVNVGDYQTTYSLSIGSDADLPDHAGWRLHLGTTDEPRYPQIMLNLRHPTFTGNVDLLNAALGIDIGDLVVIKNAPVDRGGPDDIRLIVQGYTETLGVFEHDMVLNCSPESPYRVAMLEDPVLGRADTDGSTLAAALDAPINPNPFFAGGSSAGWAASSASLAVVGTYGSANPLPAGGPSGYGVLITANGSPNVAITENAGQAAQPVLPNTSYNISALVYYPSAAHTVEIGIGWQDSSRSPISSGTSFITVAANTWVALAGQFTSPSTAAFGYPIVGLGGTPSVGDTLYAAAIPMWQAPVSVATTGPQPTSPLWTTNAADFPFDIKVGGERMTVTGITGASSPQAFTVARCVNGVAKPQTAGSDVRLWQPMILSL